MRRYILAGTVGVFVWCLAGLAIAQPPGECRGDVEKLCKGVAPGGGRFLACLKTHESELSKPCHDALAKSPAGAQVDYANIFASCKEDVRSHCSGVQRGGGRIIACLHENESKLTPACKAAMSGGKKQ